MTGTKQSTLQLTEHYVPRSDDPPYDFQVNTVDDSEHVGEAAKVLTELMKSRQATVNLIHVVGIVFKVNHRRRIVYVVDANMSLLQQFPEEHVFVTAFLESLVELTDRHERSFYHEVSGAETVIRSLTALSYRMLHFTTLLVEISQVSIRPLADSDAPIYDPVEVSLQVFINEMIVGNQHVAVEKQQPLILGFGGEKIPCCRTTSVAFLLNENTMSLLAYYSVRGNSIFPRRTVIGHDDFVSETGICFFNIFTKHQ